MTVCGWIAAYLACGLVLEIVMHRSDRGLKVRPVCLGTAALWPVVVLMAVAMRAQRRLP